MEGPTNSLSKMETGRLRMNYLFPCSAIYISIYLENSSVHAILSSCSGGVMKGELWSYFACLAPGTGDASITVQA